MTFNHQARKIIFLFIVVFSLVCALIYFSSQDMANLDQSELLLQTYLNPLKPGASFTGTEAPDANFNPWLCGDVLELRECPDGSYVERFGPDCQFAPCPVDSFSGGGAISNPVGAEGEVVFCTMDAKVCPDGSYVGRLAPDCQFAPCPGAGSPSGQLSEPVLPPGSLARELSACLLLSDWSAHDRCRQILESITDFSTCVRAGLPILESYPAQCYLPDGRVFYSPMD